MIFFTKNKHDNTLISILSLLGVKYINSYTNKYFNDHPNKYDMFGLSKILMHYGVDNMGVKIQNRDDNIHGIGIPFIAHIGNDFVTVENVSKNEVNYLWNQKKLTVPISEFTRIWTGTTLIVEIRENSREPNYKKHRRKELITGLQFYSVSILEVFETSSTITSIMLVCT